VVLWQDTRTQYVYRTAQDAAKYDCTAGRVTLGLSSAVARERGAVGRADREPCCNHTDRLSVAANTRSRKSAP
jgi:hypothetical protein